MRGPPGASQRGWRLAYVLTRTGVRLKWDVGAGLNRVHSTANFMRMRRANTLHHAANSFDVGVLVCAGRACLSQNMSEWIRTCSSLLLVQVALSVRAPCACLVGLSQQCAVLVPILA